MSMRNEPIDPLETVDDMEFNLMDTPEITKQTEISHPAKKRGSYF